MKEGTAYISDTHTVRMLFDHDAPPCPNGSCGSCVDPCPTGTGLTDGVWETPYQVVAGMRTLSAVRNNVLIMTGLVPIGGDSTRMIRRLRDELIRPRLSVSRGGEV